MIYLEGGLVLEYGYTLKYLNIDTIKVKSKSSPTANKENNYNILASN